MFDRNVEAALMQQTYPVHVALPRFPGNRLPGNIDARVFNPQPAPAAQEADRVRELAVRAPLSPLLAIAPGPTQVIASSASLAWQGILLEKHVTSPGERGPASIDTHVLSMSTCRPARFEHRAVSGQFIACLNRPGTIMVTPRGRVPEMRMQSASEFIHCALDEQFVRRVMEELNCRTISATFRPCVQDKPVQRILAMLAEELEAEKPLGRLYVDSLAHALAARYILLDCASDERSRSQATGLLPRVLKRVREKIEANLDAELSLDCLARESGYSRAHFLRMFRATTGLTPHQYVLDLRLRRAQEILKCKDSKIIDIALSCGFSSQSHMTTAFRQHLGMTPGEYRRNPVS